MKAARSPAHLRSRVKGKVTQRVSEGLPVVTTSMGAEGSGLRIGYEALSADDPKAFAHEVVRLYEDVNLWTAISEAGRKQAESSYWPHAVKMRLRAVLQKLEINGPGT